MPKNTRPALCQYCSKPLAYLDYRGHEKIEGIYHLSLGLEVEKTNEECHERYKCPNCRRTLATNWQDADKVLKGKKVTK